MQSSTRIKLLVSLVVFLLAAGLVVLGAYVGFAIKDRELRERVEYVRKARTLGDLFQKEGIEPFAYAYDDPQQALEEMGNYTWSIPVVPTPFVGTAPAPGRHDNSVINELQFRDSRSIPAVKPPGVKRIFLIGGSTTFGVGAPSQDETIGAFLEALLNQRASAGPGPGGQEVEDTRAGSAGRQEPDGEYRVYTLASPSWSSTHERIAVENRLARLDPDLIISLSGYNDVYWAWEGRNILWARTHQERYFWLLLRAVHRAHGAWDLSDVEESSQEPVDPALISDRLEANIRLSDFAARLEDRRYLFVLQPTIYWTQKPLTPREAHWRREDQAAYYAQAGTAIEALLERLRSQGLLTASAADAFDSRPAGEDVFLDAVHFGDRGNRLIAQRLAPEVTRALLRRPR